MSRATSSERLGWTGLAFVLFGLAAMTLEATSQGVRWTMLVTIALVLAIHFFELKIKISSDRARMFATVGIVGYIMTGIPRLRSAMSFEGDDPSETINRFFIGLALVFTVHQLGALARLGAGGMRAPVYMVGIVHIIGAANERPSSPLVPWLVAIWSILGIAVLRSEYQPARSRLARRFFSRATVLGTAIALAIAVALSIGLPWLQTSSLLQRLLGGKGGKSSGYNSDTSKIGDVASIKLSDDPILRVDGEWTPGMHLRGSVLSRVRFSGHVCRFDTPPEWRLAASAEYVPLPQRSFKSGVGFKIGPLPESAVFSGRQQSMRVRLAGNYLSAVRPAPLGARYLICPSQADSEVSFNTSTSLQLRLQDAAERMREYGIEYQNESLILPELRENAAPMPDEPDDAWEYLGLESDPIPKRIKELALEITADARDPASAARAIESYFTASGQFVYSLEVGPDYGVEEFLFAEHGRRGWCEYFAAAMTLMLRACEIPSRYITGYVVGENNSIGDYAIVRGRDAHAWVEAYIPGHGWRTFDPTPVDMRRVGGADSTGFFAGLWDSLSLAIADAWSSLSAGSWLAAVKRVMGAILKVAMTLASSPAALVLFVALIAWLTIKRMRVWDGKRQERLAAQRLDAAEPALRRLRQSYEQCCERARGLGVTLAPGDPPRRVVQKLNETSAALGFDRAAFAALVEIIYTERYRGRPLDLARIEAIAREL